MDAKTEELRAAHDALAEVYAGQLAGALDRMPVEQAVLGLFCDLTLRSGLGGDVADIGCGTGRLEPYLSSQGLSPRGIDLSPEMVRVARRDHPGFPFEVADLRHLPFEDASLAGVVCWYSLMYLAPSDRPRAFRELHRVVMPGGYLVTAFKAGDSEVRRGGRSAQLGVEFDLYYLSPEEMERRAVDAGFTPVFWGGRPAEGKEGSAQGYLLARAGLDGKSLVTGQYQAAASRSTASVNRSDDVAMFSLTWPSPPGPNVRPSLTSTRPRASATAAGSSCPRARTSSQAR